MMKQKKIVTDLREKTVAELVVIAGELQKEISSETVQSYFSDQTSVNNVQSSRKKLARVLTIIKEKEQEASKKEEIQ
jgi:ribosomal protein L29